MNAISLSIASIKSRPLNAFLCAFTAAAGMALLCLFTLLSQGIADGFTRNARGIDLVAGAKGSPLQLVLSSVYHADVPTGNIDKEEFEKLQKNPQVKRAIPLALGDNYKGWRIVGTTPAYLDLYKAEVADGAVFSKPFEVVAGALTGLSVGAEFAGAHGFSADSDDVHDFHLYKITGVLKPTGTVLDRLIVTSYESVQELHAHHEDAHEEEGHHHEESPEDEAAEEAMAHQVTAVLLQVKSPLAVMNLPRSINRNTNIQAAAPSYEITRLAQNLGIGRDLMLSAGIVFVGLSVLMLLSSLISSLSLRKYDLAVLRVLGARPRMLFSVVMAEGIILALAGTIIGILAGHGMAFFAVSELKNLNGIIAPSSMLSPGINDVIFAGLGLLAGVFAAMVPAFLAAKTDIAGILARGRG